MSSPITLIGNVTNVPNLRFGQSGRAFVTFSVAVGDRKKNKDGVWEDAGSSFFNVTAFGLDAENIAASIPKGTRVVVLGSMKERRYDLADGTKGKSNDVIASEVTPSLKWATVVVSRVPRSSSVPLPLPVPVPLPLPVHLVLPTAPPTGIGV